MRIALVCLLALIIASCAGTKQGQKSRENPSFGEQIVKYEASFRPSDYDPDPGRRTGAPSDQPASGVDLPPDTTAASQGDVVQGFRVQLFSSVNIDDAKAKKAEVEAAFPGEWFYLEYDPPAYKVRAGNFASRFEADRFVKQLDEKGYSGAWTVPARILRNPPPPPQR